MRRGDLVTIALQGDYGKPRPALIVQSDLFNEHPSVTALPVTSELCETPLFRIRLEPTPANGLHKVSDVMMDKAQSVPRDRIEDVFGHLGVELSHASPYCQRSNPNPARNAWSAEPCSAAAVRCSGARIN
jgi:mRNA interferase MazF